MNFAKYQGTGNDFLIVDGRGSESNARILEALSASSPKAAKRIRGICDRRFGVGADGILLVADGPSRAHAQMVVRNADASTPEMCGNGIRCVAKYLWADHGNTEPLSIMTGAGVLTATTADGGGLISIDMGPARLLPSDLPMRASTLDEPFVKTAVVGFEEFPLTAVSMGNPHVVHFTSDSAASLMELAKTHGPSLEIHAAFPERTNVEFARVRNRNDIELVVWERGCGITLACGTGACATVAAACLEGHVDPATAVRVELPGGSLKIQVAPDYQAVRMSGPAEFVYNGDLDLSLF